MPRRIMVRKSNNARGLSYLPSGQQYVGNLPAGEYRVIGECVCRYTDLGRPAESAAVKIERVIGGEHWYIAPSLAESLPTVVGEPDDAPIGSRWRTDGGKVWQVIEHVGTDYVKVAPLLRHDIPDTNDTYTWHVSSLIETTARRIK